MYIHVYISCPQMMSQSLSFFMFLLEMKDRK